MQYHGYIWKQLLYIWSNVSIQTNEQHKSFEHTVLEICVHFLLILYFFNIRLEVTNLVK